MPLMEMWMPRRAWSSGRTRAELADAMQVELTRLPGLRYSFSQPIALRVNELISGVKSDLAVKVFGPDLPTLKGFADRIGVMYAGELVEVASREAFFAQPAHPYSVRLFAALPDAERRGGRLATIPGSVPAAEIRHPGCRFVDRCSEVMA